MPHLVQESGIRGVNDGKVNHLVHHHRAGLPKQAQRNFRCWCCKFVFRSFFYSRRYIWGSLLLPLYIVSIYPNWQGHQENYISNITTGKCPKKHRAQMSTLIDHLPERRSKWYYAVLLMQSVPLSLRKHFVFPELYW